MDIVNIASHNGMSPGRCQAITWTNTDWFKKFESNWRFFIENIVYKLQDIFALSVANIQCQIVPISENLLIINGVQITSVVSCKVTFQLRLLFVISVSLSGVPDYFDRNKISSGGDLSHYSSASLY